MTAPKTKTPRLTPAHVVAILRSELARAATVPAKIETVARNECAAVPEAIRHIDSHLDELSNVWERLVKLTDRAEAVADRLVGRAPSEAGSPTPPLPNPTSAVEKFGAASGALHAIASRLDYALERLERL